MHAARGWVNLRLYDHKLVWMSMQGLGLQQTFKLMAMSCFLLAQIAMRMPAWTHGA